MRSLAVLLLAACTAKPAPLVREIEGEPEVIELGERRPGVLKWVSANARFVAISLYPEGVIGRELRSGVAPILALYDTVEGTRRLIEEVVATDPRGRWAVILAGKHLWLLDGETGARDDLAARGADLTADRQRCWDGRQAAFDPWGTEVLYLRTAPDRAVIRRLRDGHEREVAAPPYRVWRAQPTGAPGWTRFLVLPRDSDGDGAIGFPGLDLDCERWDDRRPFDEALRVVPVQTGDIPAVVLVHDSGARVQSGFGAVPEPIDEEKIEQPWVAYGPDTFGTFAVADALLRADGTTIEAPARCQWRTDEARPAALLECDEGVRALRSVVAGELTLAGVKKLLKGAAVDASGAPWSAAWIDVDGDYRLGRVDLASGKIELDRSRIEMPRYDDGITQDRRGWLMSRTYDAFHVPTGRARRLPSHEGLLYYGARERGMITVDGRMFAVDLEGARMLPLAEQPIAVAENGCALVDPSSAEPAVAGSWALICPPGRALRLDRGP